MKETGAAGFEVVRLHRLDGEGKVKAFCDVGFAGVFIIKGLRVVEGKNGLFVGMPREQGKDGKWYDTIRPLSPEFKEQLQDAVLEAYEAEV